MSNIPQQPRLVALRVAGAALVLAITKGAVGLLTGSLALLSSALDSIGDSLASSVNFVFLTIASKPPDSDHQFGHGKAENLAVLFQGIVILAGSILLLREAIYRLRHPAAVEISIVAIVVMLASTVASIVITRYLNTNASEQESSALAADAAHYNSDVVANIATLASIIASRLLNMPLLDSIFAIVVGLWIASTALRLLFDAANDLMDRALPEEEVTKIIQTIEKAHPSVRGFDNLRTRRAAGVRFIEFELWIDRTVSFEAAHDITEQIKARIREEFPKAMLAVHPEPVGAHCALPTEQRSADAHVGA